MKKRVAAMLARAIAAPPAAVPAPAIRVIKVAAGRCADIPMTAVSRPASTVAVIVADAAVRKKRILASTFSPWIRWASARLNCLWRKGFALTLA